CRPYSECGELPLLRREFLRGRDGTSGRVLLQGRHRPAAGPRTARLRDRRLQRPHCDAVQRLTISSIRNLRSWRMKLALVRGTTRSTQAFCTVPCEPIGGTYLRDIATRLSHPQVLPRSRQSP